MRQWLEEGYHKPMLGVCVRADACVCVCVCVFVCVSNATGNKCDLLGFQQPVWQAKPNPMNLKVVNAGDSECQRKCSSECQRKCLTLNIQKKSTDPKYLHEMLSCKNKSGIILLYICRWIVWSSLSSYSTKQKNFPSSNDTTVPYKTRPTVC